MRGTLALMLGLTLAVGIALGMIGTKVLNAQQYQTGTVKRTVLQKAELESCPGQEVNMVMVDLPPGALNPKHYHPGPVIAYVLSGGGTWKPMEGASKDLKPESTLYIPTKQVHEEVAGPSGEKAIVVFIGPKGMPLTIPVK